jgi:hypothetical protein
MTPVPTLRSHQAVSVVAQEAPIKETESIEARLTSFPPLVQSSFDLRERGDELDEGGLRVRLAHADDDDQPGEPDGEARTGGRGKRREEEGKGRRGQLR